MATGRLAIMQPYFFPHLAHFALAANVDEWVVFDVTQYTPKTWMNRNRVLHPKAGWMYVTADVKHSSQNVLIREVIVDDVERTLVSARGKLAHYRRHAPHFATVMDLLETAFAGRRSDSLVDLNASALSAVFELLRMRPTVSVCSELGLDLSGVEHAGQWAVRIAQQLSAREYLNPVGGAALFRPSEFAAAGVGLRFLEVKPMDYDVSPFVFEPSLSILDVLMWNEPVAIREYIEATSRLLTPEEEGA